MDPDVEQEHEVERSRNAFAREGSGCEQVHDPRTPLERAAAGVGNRAFAQVIARMRDGEGVLAGGLVHPDVEAAIAASRGGGRLAGDVSRHLESSFGEPLGDVRVHTDDHAAALARAVSARAFTVGNDIFFGPGEYQPGSRGGDELIAHEVAHVVQQRGAPTNGPLTVSEPGDASEREAEGLAREIAG